MDYKTFEVTCWADNGNPEQEDSNPIYDKKRVVARHQRNAIIAADTEHAEKKGTLPTRRRHLISPVRA